MTERSVINPPSPERTGAERRKYNAIRERIVRKYWRHIWIFRKDGSLEIYDKSHWRLGYSKLIKRFPVIE